MALRQRDASTATAALAGVALEDIARAVPALDLLPASETLNGTTLEGQQLRSRRTFARPPRQPGASTGPMPGEISSSDALVRGLPGS